MNGQPGVTGIRGGAVMNGPMSPDCLTNGRVSHGSGEAA